MYKVEGQPALTYSLRGQLALQIDVRGASHDLHSGDFGGAVHDPLQALCEIVAQRHDRRGRMAIPGFYDRVRVGSEAEREYLAWTGPKDKEVLLEAGTSMAWGERGFSIYEKFSLQNLQREILTSIAFLEEFGCTP